MLINFTINEGDKIITEKSIKITKIESNTILYCACRYIAIHLQNQFRHGSGEYGKLNIHGNEIEYKELN